MMIIALDTAQYLVGMYQGLNMRRACLNVIPKIFAICSHGGTAVKHDLNFIVSLGEKHQLLLAVCLQSSVV